MKIALIYQELEVLISVHVFHTPALSVNCMLGALIFTGFQIGLGGWKRNVQSNSY